MYDEPRGTFKPHEGTLEMCWAVWNSDSPIAIIVSIGRPDDQTREEGEWLRWETATSACWLPATVMLCPSKNPLRRV